MPAIHVACGHRAQRRSAFILAGEQPRARTRAHIQLPHGQVDLRRGRVAGRATAVAGAEAGCGESRGGRISDVAAHLKLVDAEKGGCQREGGAEIRLISELRNLSFLSSRDLHHPPRIGECRRKGIRPHGRRRAIDVRAKPKHGAQHPFPIVAHDRTRAGTRVDELDGAEGAG